MQSQCTQMNFILIYKQWTIGNLNENSTIYNKTKNKMFKYKSNNVCARSVIWQKWNTNKEMKENLYK